MFYICTSCRYNLWYRNIPTVSSSEWPINQVQCRYYTCTPAGNAHVLLQVMFMYSCRYSCRYCTYSPRCDPWSGECECKPGFSGPECQRPCPVYTYGQGCSQVTRCPCVSPPPGRCAPVTTLPTVNLPMAPVSVLLAGWGRPVTNLVSQEGGIQAPGLGFLQLY